MGLFFCWLYTDCLFQLSSMLSEIDKTTALFDVLFGRLSAKGLSSRENSEKQSSSIAINAILTGSGFAPIPWLPVPEFNSFRGKFSKSWGKNEKRVDKQDFSCYEHNA